MLDKEFCELVEMNVHLALKEAYCTVHTVRQMIIIFMAIVRNSSYTLHSFIVTYIVLKIKKYYRN